MNARVVCLYRARHNRHRVRKLETSDCRRGASVPSDGCGLRKAARRSEGIAASTERHPHARTPRLRCIPAGRHRFRRLRRKPLRVRGDVGRARPSGAVAQHPVCGSVDSTGEAVAVPTTPAALTLGSVNARHSLIGSSGLLPRPPIAGPTHGPSGRPRTRELPTLQYVAVRTFG